VLSQGASTPLGPFLRSLRTRAAAAQEKDVRRGENRAGPFVRVVDPTVSNPSNVH